MLFYDLDGLSTVKKHVKNVQNHQIWVRGSHFMVKNHSMDTRTIFSIFRATEGVITPKIMRIGGVGLYFMD